MIKALAAVIPILLFSACQKAETAYPPLTASEISGARLWRRITVETDYDAYPEWPGFEGLQLGQSPHGRYHEIYVNPVLRRALPIKNKVVPEGGIIIKENFDADKNKIGYTVMAKVKDYHPEAGDWFWASFDAGGTALAEGRVTMCIRCHEGMKSNDYVIVRALDRDMAGTEK